jgi:glycerol uptake facilitator protein
MNPFVGELVGTLFLIIFGGGVVANVLLCQSKGENAGWMTIATGWSIAVTIGVFVAESFGSANADINPAVSLAKFLALHSYTLQQMLIMQCAQFIGAFLGAVIVWLTYLPHWRVTKNAHFKLMVFATSPAIRHFPYNLLAEIIGTAVLVIGVASIFGSATQHGAVATGLGPYLVGVLVWGIGLSLGGPTGYAINPARDLGPRLAHAILPIDGKGSSEWSYAWVPVVGPLIGCVLGSAVWKVIL